MLKIKQLVNDKNNWAVNQIVVETNKYIFFQSYEAIIARYNKENGKIVLSKDWEYSKTTRKHLYIFLRDYTSHSVYSYNDVRNNIKNKVFNTKKSLKY